MTTGWSGSPPRLGWVVGRLEKTPTLMEMKSRPCVYVQRPRYTTTIIFGALAHFLVTWCLWHRKGEGGFEMFNIFLAAAAAAANEENNTSLCS